MLFSSRNPLIQSPTFILCYSASALGNYPFWTTQYIHYHVGPSSASIKTGSQPHVPKILSSSSNTQTNLSGWNLKCCYLMLDVISAVLENDHTPFKKLQRDLFLVMWDFQHISLWLKSPITRYSFPYITDKSSGSNSPLNVSPWSLIPFTAHTACLTLNPSFVSWSFNINIFNSKAVQRVPPVPSHPSISLGYTLLFIHILLSAVLMLQS